MGVLVTTNDAFFGLDGSQVTGGLWRASTTAPADLSAAEWTRSNPVDAIDVVRGSEHAPRSAGRRYAVRIARVG